MTHRRRRVIKVLLIAAPTLLVLYALVGFFGVPLLIRKVILPRVSEGLNGEVRVAEAACNPFVLSVTLTGLEVVDAAGVRVVGCDRVHANAQISSLWRGGPHFRELALDRPFVAAELAEGGVLNLAGLVKPGEEPPADEEPGEPWRLSAERLAIVAGRIEFRDFTPETPFEIVAAPVDVVFEDFDTDPDNSNTLRFSAAVESGGTLTWEGDFFLDPLSSRGRIELAGLTLERFRPYLTEVTDAELTRGVTGVTLGYRFAPVQTPQVAEVTLEEYRLADLTLSLGGRPLLDLSEVVLEGVRADAVDRDLEAARLRVRGVRVRIEREEGGSLRVMSAVERPTGGGAAAAARERGEEGAGSEPAATSPIAQVLDATIELLLQALNPWSVRVEQVVLEDASLRWVDRAVAEPVDVAFEAVRLEAGPILSEEGYVVPLKLAFTVAETGGAMISGRLGLEAMDAELDVKLDALPLAPFAAYLREAQPELSLVDGRLSVSGRAAASAVDAAAPQLTFTGEVGVGSLRVETGSEGDVPLVAWDDLRIAGIRFDHAAAIAHADRVELGGLTGGVVRTATADSAEGGEEEEPAAESPDRAPLPYAVTVDELRVTSRDLTLLDPTVDPAGRLTLSGLDVTVRGLDSSGEEAATVDLRGTLQGEASLEARGTVTPRLDAPGVDLVLRVAALPMTPFSGYTGEYLGFPVESGELDSDVSLKLERQQLDAEVSLVLDTFHLGDRLRDTDAPNLPVKLALGLLRNRQDRIDLRVPIQGDLSDPSVQVGHLVAQAIVNTLTRIAASPFDFIAGAVTGGGGEAAPEDLDVIRFAEGEADIGGGEAARKLDLLAEAMRDRPALTLVVRGGASPAADEPALRKQRLLAQIRQQLAEEGQDPARIDVPPAQYRYAIQRLALASASAEGGEGGEGGDVPILDGGAEAVGLTIPEPPTPPRRAMRGGRSVRRPPPPPAVTEAPAATGAGGLPAEVAGMPFEEAEAAALAAVRLPPDALAQLATRRAQAVRDRLVEAGGIEPGRVRLGEAADAGDQPAVRLELE